MSSTINFVQERRKHLSFAEQEDRKRFNTVLRVFIGIIVLFVVISGVQFYLTYQIKAIRDEQARTRIAIQQQEAVEREYSIFAHKLKLLTELWGARQKKQEAIAYFNSLFQGGATISGIEYVAGVEALTFQLKADSIFVLENVFTTLSSPLVLEKFPSISKSRLTRSSDASYTMAITVTLSGGAE
jgi:hypothetical protein